jgi:hypothetical protein
MSGSDFGLAAPATRIGHTCVIGTFTPKLDRGGDYLDAAESGSVVPVLVSRRGPTSKLSANIRPLNLGSGRSPT